ncbi:MAG: LytTR family DNA-binding domain-containing protein [Bacteroidota bacterium]
MAKQETITALIIDDEPEARGLLRRMLAALPGAPKLVGEADDISSGQAAILQHQPQLIFLDVQLKSGTGFDLLNLLPSLEAEVIFVTAYDQYALRAFDFAAIGYLLKPLNIRELREAYQRFRDRQTPQGHQRLETLLRDNQSQRLEHIVVPNQSGFRVIKLPEILYLQGEVNYTRFFLSDGTKLLASKTLKEYDRLLSDNGFCRIHQRYLINVKHVISYQRGEGGTVKLNNGTSLDVSRRRKAAFLHYFSA